MRTRYYMGKGRCGARDFFKAARALLKHQHNRKIRREPIDLDE